MKPYKFQAVLDALDHFQFTGIDKDVYVGLIYKAENREDYYNLLARYHRGLDENIDFDLLGEFVLHVYAQL